MEPQQIAPALDEAADFPDFTRQQLDARAGDDQCADVVRNLRMFRQCQRARLESAFAQLLRPQRIVEIGLPFRAALAVTGEEDKPAFAPVPESCERIGDGLLIQ